MSSGAVNVRQARPEDVPALSLLLGLLFAQEREFQPNRELQQKGLTRILGDPALGTVFVALCDGELCGMVNLLYTVSTALGARVALLEDLIVAPGARGAGVGQTLLQAAIDHCTAAGCKRITLLTEGENAGAHRLYDRAGFVRSSMVAFRMQL